MTEAEEFFEALDVLPCVKCGVDLPVDYIYLCEKCFKEHDWTEWREITKGHEHRPAIATRRARRQG